MPKSSLNDAEKRIYKTKLLTTADITNDPAVLKVYVASKSKPPR